MLTLREIMWVRLEDDSEQELSTAVKCVGAGGKSTIKHIYTQRSTARVKDDSKGQGRYRRSRTTPKVKDDTEGQG